MSFSEGFGLDTHSIRSTAAPLGLLMQFGSATFHTASGESITNVHSAASPTGSATECYDIMMTTIRRLSSHPKSDPEVETGA